MTRTEARAILNCAKRINGAVEACLDKLGPDEKLQADAYWAAHIKNIIAGSSYGSMPTNKAHDVLYPDGEE